MDKIYRVRIENRINNLSWSFYFNKLPTTFRLKRTFFRWLTKQIPEIEDTYYIRVEQVKIHDPDNLEKGD